MTILSMTHPVKRILGGAEVFRTVKLPESVAGYLFLHSMPGRYETYEDASREIARHQIACVVCLAPFAEVKTKAPDYGQAIETRRLLWDQEMCPVPDYGVPGDCDAFWRLAQRLALRLQTGEHILIHCGAGIGRTGTLAMCVLLALGYPLNRVRAAVQDAGSSPETPAQHQVVSWAATQGRAREAEL